MSTLSSLIATGITSSILIKNSLNDRGLITAVDDMTVHNKKPELDQTRFENVSVNGNAPTCNRNVLQQRTLIDMVDPNVHDEEKQGKAAQMVSDCRNMRMCGNAMQQQTADNNNKYHNHQER